MIRLIDRTPWWIGKVWAKGRRNDKTGDNETIKTEKATPIEFKPGGKGVSYSKYMVNTSPYDPDASVDRRWRGWPPRQKVGEMLKQALVKR